jgi:hypothetical protein
VGIGKKARLPAGRGTVKRKIVAVAPVAGSGRSPRVLAALMAVVALAACAVVAAGYYALRARAYSSLDLVLEGDFPIEADEEMGFVPIRNGASLRRHPRTGLSYRIFTSDRRARVSAAGESTPPVVDLMTIGCSFSWGHGVENPETYTAILARRHSLRVANLAFSSYGTVQAVQMLERNRDLQPKVVIYGVIQDHMKRNLSPCAPVYGPACLPYAWVDFDAQERPFLHPPNNDDYDFSRRFWDAFFFRRGSWARRLGMALEADARRLANPPGDDGGPERRQKAMAFLLERMRAAARGIGAHLVVVYIPYLERGGTPEPSAALAAALREVAAPDVTVVDLAPVVARHYADPASALLRFERDRHPSPAAHALFAGALEPVLRARGLVPR